MSHSHQAHDTISQRIKHALPSLALLLSLLSLCSGLLGIAFVQDKEMNQSFDIRQQASTEFDHTTILTSPQAGTKLSADPSQRSSIDFDISHTRFDTASVVLFITSKSIQNPEIKTPANFSITKSEIEQTKDGYAVSLLLEKKSVVSNGQTAARLFSFEFTPSVTDTIFLSFDQEKSLIMSGKTTEFIAAQSSTVYIVIPSAASPSPTATPQVSPTPSSTPLPRVTPSPIGSNIQSCNQSCNTHADCGVNNICYNAGNGKVCRLAINPSSTSCSTTATGTQSCNQYCVNNSECSTGLTCWSNRCRRSENIESTSCTPLSSTNTQAITQSCNSGCRSNRECPINMRCYNSTCRLASNPSSTSCSAPTAPTVSSEYGDNKGGSASDSASATDSSEINTDFIPIASPDTSDIVPPTVEQNDQSNGPVATLQRYIHNNGRQLAIGLIILGIALFILFLILQLIRKLKRRRPPQGVLTPLESTEPKPKPDSTLSNNLQAKINTKPIEPFDKQVTQPLPNRAEHSIKPSPVVAIPPQSPPEIKPAPMPLVLPPHELKPSPLLMPQAESPAPVSTPNVTVQKPAGSMLDRIQQKNISIPDAPATTSNLPPIHSSTPNASTKPSGTMVQRIQEKQIKLGN